MWQLSENGKLLRVLESGEFLPVGDTRPRWTHTRIISATNAARAAGLPGISRITLQRKIKAYGLRGVQLLFWLSAFDLSLCTFFVGDV